MEIGCDIIQLSRFIDVLERKGEAFLNKVFTDSERELGKDKNPEYYAGRFAAKEAISKALGSGIGKQLSWHDIEILKNPQGKPIASLSTKAATHWQSPSIKISISHCKEYAMAVALYLP